MSVLTWTRADYHAIARDAITELRRQMCRCGPHDQTPAAMLKCPRCGPVFRFDLAAAQAAIVREVDRRD